MTLYLLSKFFSDSCVTLPELKANLVEFVQDLTCTVFSGFPLFILTLTCLTKNAENVSKMLKARLERVPAAPIKVILIINCTCIVFIDNFRNI